MQALYELGETKYEYVLGQKFPIERYLMPFDLIIAIITNNFFNVLYSCTGLMQHEIDEWTKSSLTVSVFVRDDVPYIIFDYGTLSSDVSLHLCQMPEENLDNWLNSDYSCINMFLVDADTGILKGMKSITLNPNLSDLIRDTCEKQTYLELNDIIQSRNMTYSKYSTRQMIRRSQLQQSFPKSNY